MQYMTPKKVASLLGVSESTVRRLCDKGEIKFVKTSGNHRRILQTELVRYARANNFVLDIPSEIATVGGGKLASASVLASRYHEQLYALNQAALETAVDILYASGWTAAQIIDHTIAPALRKVGDDWAHGKVFVDEEHQMTMLTHRVLVTLRSLLPTPSTSAPTVVCAAPQDDDYLLPTTMAATLLLGEGCAVAELGADTPTEAILRTAEKRRADLVVLSFTSSFGLAPEDVIAELGPKKESLGFKLAVGGRALSPQETQHSLEENPGVDFVGSSGCELAKFVQDIGIIGRG